MTSRPALAALALVAAGCLPATAQVTVKPDGQWRHLIGAGASLASGNSDAKSLNLSYDGVRATASEKWSLTGRALYARDGDETTGQRVSTGIQYNSDITPDVFSFASADVLHDRPANLQLRASVGDGLGYHVRRDERGFFDVSGGLGYTYDDYDESARVDGAERTHYGRFELLLGEESTHQLTDTTALKQKLRVRANLRNIGGVRSDFETGLTVAVNHAVNLIVGFTHRYDSDPGSDVEHTDTLFTTGLSVRID